MENGTSQTVTPEKKKEKVVSFDPKEAQSVGTPAKAPLIGEEDLSGLNTPYKDSVQSLSLQLNPDEMKEAEYVAQLSFARATKSCS